MASPDNPPLIAMLFDALDRADTQALGAALALGAPADAVDPRSPPGLAFSALFNAATARCGFGPSTRQTLCLALLNAGANPNFRSEPGGWTPALGACADAGASMLALLERFGADWTLRVEPAGLSAPMIAAREGRRDGLAFLIERGADLLALDAEGKDALAWARQEGHDHCAQMIQAALFASSLGQAIAAPGLGASPGQSKPGRF